MIDQNEIKSAFNHFVMGWHFITQKGLRRFVIMPILLNVVLLTGLFWLFVSQISTMIDWVMSFIPDWLSFLNVILLVLSIGSILLFFYFAFTTLSGFIADVYKRQGVATLAEKYFGITGRVLATFSLLILLYALSAAYITGGGLSLIHI